jgi:hypothetical protein
MKKEIVTYKIGEFSNYAGISQKITMCAVSNSTFENLERELYIGISICNPEDEYNEELGKKIAYSKAVNSDPVLMATVPGIINSTLVESVLNSELGFIIKHPGKYITGYDKKAKKYFDKKLAIDMFNSMDVDQQAIVKAIQEGKFYLSSYEFVAKMLK